MTTERIDNPFRKAPAPPPRDAPSAPLSLRAMTGFEEELVERSQYHHNTAALCNELLARCSVAPGGDFNDALARVRSLPVAARDACLLTLRRLSLGDRVDTEVDCPACKGSNAVSFPLSALPVPEPSQATEARATLSDGREARMRTPTAGDQEALLDARAETDAERRTFVLARVILQIGDRTGPFDPEEVRGFNTADRRAIEAAVEAAMPALDLRMDTACSLCGHAFAAPFDVASFFLPR